MMLGKLRKRYCLWFTILMVIMCAVTKLLSNTDNLHVDKTGIRHSVSDLQQRVLLEQHQQSQQNIYSAET